MGRMTVGQLLDVFKNARNGDPKARTFAIRFERLARVRREKEHWKGIYTQELVRASLSLFLCDKPSTNSENNNNLLIIYCTQAWIQKLRKRPILTGGFLRPSLFNRPLPRMRNQPLDITMMINKRIKARTRRQVAFDAWTEMKEDIKRESAFERNLARICGEGPEMFPFGLAFGNVQEWCMCLSSFLFFLLVWVSGCQTHAGGPLHSRTDDLI